MATHKGQCSCGHVQFETHDDPLFRAICHCTICQRFFNGPFSDFVIFRASRLIANREDEIDYKVFQQPPLLRRGTCRACHKPALEKLSIPLLPKLTLVPSTLFSEPDELRAPDFHMFYEHRVGDHDDGLPKSKGYLPSQLAFARHLLPALLSR